MMPACAQQCENRTRVFVSQGRVMICDGLSAAVLPVILDTELIENNSFWT